MAGRKNTGIVVRDKGLVINGKKTELLSGEVHYWRLNPEYWGKCLNEVKNFGIDIIATYVCWEFCEVGRGKFDFTGETSPHHNLTGFLKLSHEKGLRVILRPGPYIYSEWDEMGIPKYAAPYHRDSAEFRKLALPYMKSVTDAVKEYQFTRGGPIILWQADNEIDFMPWAYEKELGLGVRAGEFQKFLKGKYGDIENLNRAWETSHKSFEDARAVQTRRIRVAPYHRRYMDFMEFRHRYNTHHAKWMVDTYRSLGVEVPVYLNSYPHQDSLDWRDLQNVAEIVGIDPYPANEFSDDEGDHRRFVEKIVFQNCFSAVPYIAEYEAGVWYGQHKFTGTLTPNHYRLSCLSAIAGGIAGWNWYMLVNRDNWLYSPVNERGVPNEDIAPVFGEIVRMFKKMEPSKLERMTNTAVTFELMHHALRDISEDDSSMTGLYKSGIPYEFYDLRAGNIEKPLLLYAGPDWLSKYSGAMIEKYVRNGGNLVLFGNYPWHDGENRSYEYFGIPAPEMVLPDKKLKIRLGRKILEVNSWAYGFSKLPGKAIIAENMQTVNCEQGKASLGVEYIIGSEMKLGRGKILFMAIQPDIETILAVHDYFSITIPCRALLPDTHATMLKKDAGTFFAVVISMKDCDTVVPVRISPDVKMNAGTKFVNLSTGQSVDAVKSKNGTTIYVPVGRKDAVVIKAGR